MDATIEIRLAANPFDWWPLVTEGVEEWRKSEDAELAGSDVDPWSVLTEGLRRGVLDLALILRGDQVAGFDIIARHSGSTQGNVLYLKPAFRGQGIVQEYFSRMQEMGQFWFCSKLDRWSDPRYGVVKAGDFLGVPVYERRAA